MQELIPINVTIADRTYRARIEGKDEEQVRKTLRMINEKILEFKTQFAGKDMQDYVAMVVLWYATQQQQGLGTIAEAEIAAELGRIEALLDKTLPDQ